MKTEFKFEGGKELAAALNGLSGRVSKRIALDALKEAAEPMRARAASLAPREPGAPDLAENIVVSTATRIGSTEGGKWRSAMDSKESAVAMGPAKGFYYGCVFGPMTYVPTDRGQRAICQIRVGDRVLTQTGEFRSVVATARYPAIEKPDLVTITAQYRSDQHHTLTLTRDHLVLAFRDGKFKWIEAGQLVVGDVLSKRRKTSWSKGTAVVEQRVCEACGTTYARRKGAVDGFTSGLRFCSHDCRAAWLSRRHVGMKRSDAARNKMADAQRVRLATKPETHPNRIMAAKGYKTQCERQVAEWLTARGVQFAEQHPVGGLFVDFYLPESNTVIEADGAFWHRNQRADIERDKQLRSTVPDVRIVHMHFVDPRFTPKDLDRNPMDGVSYVPCNPGPSSFVDPEKFMDTPVLSVKHWKYESGPAKLYDLTVEGVPSFVASGLVIHNSFQEYGTVHHGAQPFMRPAFDSEAQTALKILIAVLWRELAGRGIGRSISSPSSLIGEV